MYKWDHPVITALRKCGGCHKMFYCSRECQEEHWAKVHKKHCKYFTGAKNRKDTVVHDKANCNFCLPACREEAFKEDNPNYICTTAFPEAKPLMALHRIYPLPLARLQEDRLERIVDILLRLLLKLNLANVLPISQMMPKEFKTLTTKLWTMKEEMFVAKVMNPSEMGFSHIPEVSAILAVVHCECNCADCVGKPNFGLTTLLQCDHLQLVQTFLLMLELLYSVASIQAEGLLKSPEKSLPKDQRKISDSVRKSSFLNKTDQVLEALKDQIVPHSALAALVCNGSTEKMCTSCGEQIVVGTMMQ